MSKPDTALLHLRDDPDYFREAVSFTAKETSFSPRLIEKDYLCTVLLEHLLAGDSGLVFKGGTCLAKIHANFYRLSEDLDFVIPISTTAPRSERSKRAKNIKDVVAALPKRLPAFRVIKPLTGANNSTQYNALVSYTSLAGQQEDTIKIEVGLREPLELPVFGGLAQTILCNPSSNKQMVPPLPVSCIAKTEAFAEKFRAALSRREVAARDFFDLDYAVRKLGLLPDDADLIKLVRTKLAVPNNDPVDVSEGRLKVLRQQIIPQLQPVLRREDYNAFDVDRAFRLVAGMAAKAI